jgi:hypothetical protein
LGGHLLPNASGFVILHPLLYLPCRVLSFDSFIHNTRKVTEEGYSNSRSSEVRGRDTTCRTPTWFLYSIQVRTAIAFHLTAQE